MVSRKVWALSVLASNAHAFKDASPFLAFSTSNIPQFDKLQKQDDVVAQASQVTSVLSDAMSGCPSDAYVFVTQPGLSADDLRRQAAMPYLSKQMRKGDEIQSTVAIPEVAHQVPTEDMKLLLTSKCDVTRANIDALSGYMDLDDHYPQMIVIDFPSLPEDNMRADKLVDHDNFLHTVIRGLGDHSYTVVYTTSPPLDSPSDFEPSPDESAHQAFNYDVEDPSLSALHQDLRRDTTGHLHMKRQNRADDWNPPLFEKYNFLSPGIFMGLLIAVILLSILSVGLTAIGSLRVSYMAFAKEMGPAAQKKQQ